MNQLELAKLIGVSSATVSRVVNNDPRVAEATAQKVREAIKKYGYVQNNIARSLKMASSNTVALVVSDISNDFFLEILCGVEHVLSAAGYNIILQNTELSVQRERAAVDMLIGYHIAGVIMNVVDRTGGILDPLEGAGIPAVLFDRKVDTLRTDCVVIDNYGGMDQLVRYLAGLGHRRIATIHGTVDNTPGIERLEGFYRSMEGLGLPVPPEYVVNGYFHERDAYQAALELMGLPEPPTAILCQNNLMTKGAYKACQDREIRIPGDVSIIGFDDFDLASRLAPPITVLQRPVYDMGKVAAQLLITRLQERAQGVAGNPPMLYTMPTTLCERRSCSFATVSC